MWPYFAFTTLVVGERDSHQQLTVAFPRSDCQIQSIQKCRPSSSEAFDYDQHISASTNLNMQRHYFQSGQRDIRNQQKIQKRNASLKHETDGFKDRFFGDTAYNHIFWHANLSSNQPHTNCP